jgi:hypothetical protein
MDGIRVFTHPACSNVNDRSDIDVSELPDAEDQAGRCGPDRLLGLSFTLLPAWLRPT